MVEQLVRSPHSGENIATELLFNHVFRHKRLIFEGRAFYFQKVNKTAQTERSINFINVSFGNFKIFHEQLSHRLRHCGRNVKADNFAVTA